MLMLLKGTVKPEDRLPYHQRVEIMEEDDSQDPEKAARAPLTEPPIWNEMQIFELGGEILSMAPI